MGQVATILQQSSEINDLADDEVVYKRLSHGCDLFINDEAARLVLVKELLLLYRIEFIYFL